MCVSQRNMQAAQATPVVASSARAIKAIFLLNGPPLGWTCVVVAWLVACLSFYAFVQAIPPALQAPPNFALRLGTTA